MSQIQTVSLLMLIEAFHCFSFICRLFFKEFYKSRSSVVRFWCIAACQRLKVFRWIMYRMMNGAIIISKEMMSYYNFLWIWFIIDLQLQSCSLIQTVFRFVSIKLNNSKENFWKVEPAVGIHHCPWGIFQHWTYMFVCLLCTVKTDHRFIVLWTTGSWNKSCLFCFVLFTHSRSHYSIKIPSYLSNIHCHWVCCRKHRMECQKNAH